MDDLIHGADTIEESQAQIAKIIATVEAGKLTLTKLSSNHDEIMAQIADEQKLSAYQDEPSPTTKILGIHYNRMEDAFHFQVQPATKIKFTKRGLLSIAA